MIVYTDTSALAGIYLGDQPDAAQLAGIVYQGVEPVITSELTDVEIASAFARANRDGVIDSDTRDGLLSRYAADTSDSGALGVIGVTSETLARTRHYVERAPVRTLDAIHLAACALFAESVSDEVRLLSRDNRQNEAARTLGIAVLPS